MKLPYSKIRYIVAAALLFLVFPALGEVMKKQK